MKQAIFKIYYKMGITELKEISYQDEAHLTLIEKQHFLSPTIKKILIFTHKVTVFKPGLIND